MVKRNNCLIACLAQWHSNNRKLIMINIRKNKHDCYQNQPKCAVLDSSKVYTYFFILLMLTLFLYSWHAYAGTTGAELRPAAEKLAGLIGGWGGKTICLTSLTLGLIGLVGRFNPYLVTGSFGTCIVSGLGVSVVNATVTALI